MSDNRRNATLKALIDAAITELMIKTSGEQIYLDDNTTLSSKMAEMVTAINLRDKKTDVDAKIKTVTDSLNSTSESLGNAISTLRSEKADKTEVTERITALKQEIMGDLPVEAYDTFTELAAYIEEHQEAADALTAAIGNKADKTVVNDILTVINGLGALANKDKVAKDDLDASLQTELDAKATTEAMNTALSTKSNTSHTHDDRYYTKAETDTAIANAPKGDTGVWISQADYDALSDEDKALDLNYYIYDAKSNSGSDSSGISISQAEYDALSAEEKASETTYYIYDANSNPNAASIPFTSENYTATNVGAALEEVNGKLTDFLLFKSYNSEPFNINANEAKDIVIHYDSIFGYKAVACIGFSNNKSNGIFVSQSGFTINSVSGASGMFSAWCFNCTQSKNFSDVILSSCVVYIKA